MADGHQKGEPEDGTGDVDHDGPADDGDVDVDEFYPPPGSFLDTQRADHYETLDAWGVQVTRDFAVPLAARPALSALGVRRWSGKNGWEAGFAFLLGVKGSAAENQEEFGVAGSFGFLRGIGTYRHMHTYWEPSLGFAVARPEGGPVSFSIDARFSLGAEIRFGMIGLPRLGMSIRFSLGVVLADDGNDLGVELGTEGGTGNSIDGIMATTVGFSVYL